jgi:hypothetical protein
MSEVQKMADVIINKIRALKQGVSFSELADSCGDAAKGDEWMTLGSENCVLWVGVSGDFIDAFNSIVSQVTITQVNNTAGLMIYMADGGVPDLPMCPEDATSLNFEEPTWLPTTLSLKVVQPVAAD